MCRVERRELPVCQLSDGRRLKVHREQARGRPSITDGHGLATSTTAGVEGTAVLLSTQREPSFAGSGILCFGCDVLEAFYHLQPTWFHDV